MVNIGKLKFVSSILCIFSGSRAQSVVQWPLRMGKKENVSNEQDLNRASKALELCQSCIPLNWRNFCVEGQDTGSRAVHLAKFSGNLSFLLPLAVFLHHSCSFRNG